MLLYENMTEKHFFLGHCACFQDSGVRGKGGATGGKGTGGDRGQGGQGTRGVDSAFLPATGVGTPIWPPLKQITPLTALMLTINGKRDEEKLHIRTNIKKKIKKKKKS